MLHRCLAPVILVILSFYCNQALAQHNTWQKTPTQIADPNQHNTELKRPVQIANPDLHNTEIKHNVVQTSYIYPETYGARGDGVTNDSAAIQQALTRATSAHQPVFFSAKTYACAAQVTANGATALGAAGAKVLFTNPASGGIVLSGGNPNLSSLIISYSNTSSGNGVGVYINNATNFRLYNVTISACPADNIDCFSSSSGSISYCNVSASSLHQSSLLIEDCTSVTVAYNQLPNFAVLAKTTGSNNLSINNNQFTRTDTPLLTQGYGVKLSGLSNSTFSNNSINCGYVLIGSSYYYAPTNIRQTFSGSMRTISGSDGNTTNLTFSHNTINGANMTGAGSYLDNALGVVVLNMTNATITGININKNTISNIPGTTSAIYFDSTVSNSQIVNNTISAISDVYSGVPYACQAITTLSTDNITISNNTISNVTGLAILCGDDNTSSGTIAVSGNNIANVCTNPSGNYSSETSVIFSTIARATSAITITNNKYTGPANGALHYVYTDITESGLTPTISGNLQTSTNLPNYP